MLIALILESLNFETWPGQWTSPSMGTKTFVYQKALIQSFYTFVNSQHKNTKVILYWKPGFKRSFKRFLETKINLSRKIYITNKKFWFSMMKCTFHNCDTMCLLCCLYLFIKSSLLISFIRRKKMKVLLKRIYKRNLIFCIPPG